MKKYLSIFILSLVLITASGVHAHTSDVDHSHVGARLTNPLKDEIGNTLPAFFQAIVERILLPIGSIVAVIAFIWTGFLFVMAQGQPDKLETAKRALLYTAIGTAVLLGAVAISKVITGTISSIST